MAAITTVITTNAPVKRVRTFTASSVAHSDAIAVPSWAKTCRVIFNATTITTNVIWNVQGVSWGATAGTYDDSTAFNIAEHGAFTTVTSASLLTVEIGPGITGIADDVTSSATASSRIALNAVLPQVLYITGTPTGNLTATVDVEFRG